MVADTWNPSPGEKAGVVSSSSECAYKEILIKKKNKTLKEERTNA